MTEEIIIDGVNVAECAHLIIVTGEEQPFCRLDTFTCKGETCYYKQLQRLKQENENAKATVEECHKYMAKLEDENEELTRENENRNDWITSLRKQCGKLVEEKLIYRSALEEIKTILDKECGVISNAKVVGIINEVLGDE